MSTKNYKITINTNEELNFSSSDKEIQYLLDNLNKINANNVVPLPEEIDWEADAKAKAQDIWNTEDLEETLKTTAEIYTYELSRGSGNDFYTDNAFECLKQLSDYDIDEGIADTSSYSNFLQQRASLAYERVVREELERMIEDWDNS